jgi:mono/diheme cytochrome c family protein
MNGRKIITVLVIALAAISVGCSSQLYMPASSNAAQQQDLLAGRKLYVSKCGGCHNLHLPGEFSASAWEKNISEMQEKAKISDEQKKLILNYLTSQP